MALIFFSEAADADTDKIYAELVRQAGEATAARYATRFAALFRQLACFPKSGAPRPRLGPSVRLGVVEPYVVIHRYVEDTDAVQILRILHGKRNITKRMLKNVVVRPGEQREHGP